MKKNLVLCLMSAMIGLFTVATGTAYAETMKEDLNKDGIVSYEDYNLFIDSKGYNFSYDLNNDDKMDLDNDGYVGPSDQAVFNNLYPLESTNIKGDVNNDGTVNKKDLAFLEKYVQTPHFNIDSNNSDLDNNGTIDYSDYSKLKDLVKYISPKLI